VSQAEHDEQASAVLVTDSPALAVEVDRLTEARVAATLNSARAREALLGAQYAIVTLANAEELPAHGEAVEARFEV
jgi:histidinol dehydrogenase